MRWAECADTDGIAFRSILFLLVAAGLVALGIAAFLLRPAESASEARLPVGATNARDTVEVVYGVGIPIGWADDHTVVIDGDNRIVALDTDGELEILALTDRVIDSASLSPDGRKIAYTVGDGQRGGNVFLTDLDGSEPRKLASYTGTPRVTWSEDSTRVGYLSDGDWLVIGLGGGTSGPSSETLRDTRTGMLLVREEPVGEWIVAPDGQSLARDAELCSFPMLSPDGRTIACEYRKTPGDAGSAALVELR